MNTQYNLFDRGLIQLQQAIRSCVPGSHRAQRPSPADAAVTPDLSPAERRRSANLMRVNHCGEVCAQALYQGQAATARLGEVRAAMEEAAAEEVDHLVWCEARLKQLNSRPSLLNPLWYALSYGLGAAAGLAGDRWSLGFVAETERQVCRHLEGHLKRLPESDLPSRAVVTQMIEDEKRHGETATAAGGTPLPTPIRLTMSAMSHLMKSTTYHL